MRFTQRMGIGSIQKLVQRASMDEDLKISLWNALTGCYWEWVSPWEEARSSKLDALLIGLWLDFYKKPLDRMPVTFQSVLSELREWYFDANWGEVYDFVEFVSKNGPDESKENFIRLVNSFLTRENSAYRFVSDEITEITSQVEIDSVESAMDSPYQNVRSHLKTALHLMNDKEHPDYRNSIKESISAVEAAAKKVTGNDKATLDEAISIIEREGMLHKALKKAFSSLYGYTSDANGIRHALLEESSLKKSDARFMLISCSAFVNYLLELSAGK